MALSMSIEKGQFPKCCDLCETDIKIKWKCLNCNLLICTNCKDKVHSKFQSSDKHKIIDIKDVGQHSKELNFGHIQCEEDHEGQTCVMFCKSCDQLVCPQCMAGVHNGHRFVQISEEYKIKFEKAKEIQIQIKSLFQELVNEEKRINNLRDEQYSKYLETRNRIHAQNAALKMEVDKYTEKLIKELDQKWETLQNSMAAEERKVTNLKNKKEDQNTKVDDILNSKDSDQFFKKNRQMWTFTKEILKPVNLDFIPMPLFLPGKITEEHFGSLQDVRKDLVLNIHQQFTTDIRFVGFLSTCADNSLWIGDNNVLQRVNPEGSNLKVMSNFSMEIYGMAVTPSNDLLLVTGGSRLQRISGSSGQVTNTVYSVDPLILSAVHVTSDYKVTVVAHDSDRVVIIRMNTNGKHEQTYEHDRDKQPIFTYVRHITTTTNGTIFAVVKLSKDCRGRVVVLGQDGDVSNTYIGHPKINSDHKPFKPVYAVTTPSDNIIVTDRDTYTLHILNSVGHLITYYDTENMIGIVRPYALSFTSTGHLYIGCSRAVGSTDKAKLYKVGISQI